MQTNQYSDKALLIEGDMLTVPEFIKATSYPIDAFMIDRFWHTMKKGMLIYADAELITWMGYEGEAKFQKQAFTRALANARLNEDYFHYTNDEYARFLITLTNTSVLTGGASNDDKAWWLISHQQIYPNIDTSQGKGPTKHLLLTSKCLKTTMMKLSTSRGDKVREYYLALEDLFETYMNYQSDYKLQQGTRQLALYQEQLSTKDMLIATKDKQLLIEQNKNLSIQNFIANVKQLERNEYLYIVTTEQYARSNQYKIGGTEKTLKRRLSPYNCGRADGDNLYYCWIHKCHDYRLLETRIKSLLGNWRSNKNKEMYVINYAFLVKFVEIICRSDDYDTDMINNFISIEYLESMALEPIVPLPITEFDGMVFALPAPANVPLLDIVPHCEHQADSSPPTSNERRVELPPETLTPSHIEVQDDYPVDMKIESFNEPPIIIPIMVQVVDPPITIKPQVAMIDPDDEIILTVQLRRRVVDGIVVTALQAYVEVGEVKKKDLNNKLRSLLDRGKKTKFKAREWAVVYSAKAAELGVRIKK
jgi:hypothetical protein